MTRNYNTDGRGRWLWSVFQSKLPLTSRKCIDEFSDLPFATQDAWHLLYEEVMEMVMEARVKGLR